MSEDETCTLVIKGLSKKSRDLFNALAKFDVDTESRTAYLEKLIAIEAKKELHPQIWSSYINT